MSYKPKLLGHVNIFVRNAERARDWYEDLLGLHTYDFKPGVAAFMSADIEVSHEIALLEVGDNAPLQQKGQVGLNHMAWYMASVDDLKEIYHRLQEKNIPIDMVSDHGLSIGIYIRDPDGNGIELSYELPRSEWGREENIFMGVDNSEKGRFPGPWDEMLASKPAAVR
jgi:catechol 2,3-dioxygenase